MGVAMGFVDEFFDNDDNDDEDDDDDDGFDHKPKHGGCNWVWSKMDQDNHYKGGGGGHGGYHKPSPHHYRPPPYQHYGPKRYHDDEPSWHHQPYQKKKPPKRKEPLKYTHVPTNVKGPCEGPTIQKAKSHTIKANRDRSKNKKKVRADEGTHPYQDYLREQQDYQNRDYSNDWQRQRYH